MSNKNYIRGRAFEYRIVKILKNNLGDGFIVQRSAGSKSPVDIWVRENSTKQTVTIQAKSHKK